MVEILVGHFSLALMPILYISVDLDSNEVTERQPQYVGHANWTIVSEHDFLDPGNSHPFFRAFYVPLVSSRYCRYNKYVLLRRVSPRRTVPPDAR